MTEQKPQSLHVPQPPHRVGGKPNFSYVMISKAGTVRRPPIDTNAEDIRDLAYSLVRVLDREGRAVGPWSGLLGAEELGQGLRDMMLTRAFDARMLMSQRKGK